MNQLPSLFAAQPGGDPVVAPIAGLAQLLQTYGAWGLVAVLMFVVWFLFRKYVEARDKNENTLQAQVKGATDMAEEVTKASVEQKNALVNTTDALKAMERRLENVEKKLG